MSSCIFFSFLFFFFFFAVKRKHAENVPDKLSESEFWTRFFQSHYFHRDRITLGSKEIFAECAKQDEQSESQLTSNTTEQRACF